jgi:hypothetical protein
VLAQIHAEVAAYEGRLDDAAGAIASASEAGLTDLAWLTRCPLLEPVRSTPAFAAALAAVTEIAARVRTMLFDD